ncbi:hypothetical protein LOK49_LG01G02685 [Camellia lanceoleosa]|uniref:Uncharacterized protein n=1 Tax=Camellia lanceoleosa TaxID=1840588 RepID=A0ACC0J6L3_9ERIC|nr:hypothetical protein LOK49_LG01G02685 [Camellia lanceoleosa]
MADSPLPLLTQDRFELCEGSNENEDISNRCLLGKVLAAKPLNQQVVSNILLVAKMTKQNAEFIGKRLGNLIGVEAMHEGLLLNRSYLHIRVEMDVTKPLPLGFFLQHNSSPGSEQLETWVCYKYEKLADFCYDCGRVGHVNSVCKFVSRKEGKKSSYGPDLRTSRAPRLNMPLDQVKHWVDEAEIRVQALSQGRSVAARKDIPLGVSTSPADEVVIEPGGRAVLSDLHIEGGKVDTSESTIPRVVLGAMGEARETGPNLSSSRIAWPEPSYFVMEPSDQLIPLVEAQQTLDQFEPFFEIGIEEIRANSSTQLSLLALSVDHCRALNLSSRSKGQSIIYGCGSKGSLRGRPKGKLNRLTHKDAVGSSDTPISKTALSALFCQVLWVAWFIWKSRNALVFNHQPVDPLSVTFQASSNRAEFEACALKIGSRVAASLGVAAVPIPCSNLAWTPPPFGCLKANCDVAIKPGTSNLCYSLCYSCCKGHLIEGDFQKVAVHSVMQGEALAVRKACLMAQALNLSQVKIASDNKSLILLCVLENAPPWDYALIINDIRCLAEICNFSFLWSPQLANKAAHWTARAALKGMLPV